jgi:hypothetical protein
MRVEEQYTQNNGFPTNDQLVLVIVLLSECVNRPFNAKMSGPVKIIIATAIALNVVLYPYFFNSALITSGITVPLAPAALAIIPNAIPFLVTHHSSTILMIG